MTACGNDDVDEPVDEITQEGVMRDFSENEYAGSSASLHRYLLDDQRYEAEVTITGLTEGNVYTFWWIIFNDDENCVSSPNDEGNPRCGLDDFTPDQVAATTQTFAYGFPGTDGGAVAPADGTIVFPNREYRITDKTDEFAPNGEGPGITDLEGAEVHVLIRDHGPELASDDPMYDSQFTTYLGGCTEVEGPNDCAEIGFVIFLDSTVDAGSCQGHICN